jgi:hypothetical protein
MTPGTDDGDGNGGLDPDGDVDPGPDSDGDVDPGPDSDGDVDPDRSDDPADPFPPDSDRVRLLRTVADDVRGDSSESQQLAAVLYRVSDLYDPAEETTPEEIYRNVRFIMQVTERGGLER